MKTLVLGGTGAVGSQVVRQLLARGAEVSVLTRDPAKAKSLPAGARGVIGDLLDPAVVRSAFRGAEAVFLLNALGPTETHEGLMAVNGAKMAGLSRLVYLSVHYVRRAPHLPHFGSKIPVEIAIEASEIPFTILAPNNFFQNDRWLRDEIVQNGIYPTPIGDAGLSRVDVRDVAEVAAIALLSSGHEGQTYNLAGPEAVTGESTAAAWGRALGRRVVYAGNDLDAWERQAVQYLPAWLAFDLRLMYAFFQEEGLKATHADLEKMARLLGHPPRTFDAYAREMAEAWTRDRSGVTA
jgi:uncharacterized protein YbjT (DUF2867 family)